MQPSPAPLDDLGSPSSPARVIAFAALGYSIGQPFFKGLLPHSITDSLEPVIVLTAVTAILCLADGHQPELGFRARPIQGWKTWCYIAGVLAMIVLSFILLAAILFWLVGWEIPIPKANPRYLAERSFWFLLYAPIVEELVFRSLLTVALSQWIGDLGLILTSGVVFGLVHVFRGTPGPDNLVAGFLLQWAFLRSRTILVPMAMHMGGNAFALIGHTASWYGWGP